MNFFFIYEVVKFVHPKQGNFQNFSDKSLGVWKKIVASVRNLKKSCENYVKKLYGILACSKLFFVMVQTIIFSIYKMGLLTTTLWFNTSYRFFFNTFEFLIDNQHQILPLNLNQLQTVTKFILFLTATLNKSGEILMICGCDKKMFDFSLKSEWKVTNECAKWFLELEHHFYVFNYYIEELRKSNLLNEISRN